MANLACNWPGIATEFDQSRCSEVAVGPEVLLGNEDLPKSPTAPD
jgi:hypothetical protein